MFFGEEFLFLGNYLREFSQGKTVRIVKSGLATQGYLAQALLERGDSVVVLAPDHRTAQKLLALVQVFGNQGSKEFWEQDWTYLPPYLPGPENKALWAQRMASLFALSQPKPVQGIILSLDNLLPYFPPRELFDQEYLFLMVQEEAEFKTLPDKLVSWGYERVPLVTNRGDFSVRGDIVDVFAPGYPLPLRFEFFGDLLESIRLFDPITQRSKAEKSEVVLLPIGPAVLSPVFQKEALQKWEHLWKIGSLSKVLRQELTGLMEQGETNIQPGLFYQHPSHIGHWLPKEVTFLLLEAERIRERLDERETAWKEACCELYPGIRGAKVPMEELIQPLVRARKLWIDRRQILFEDLSLGSKKGIELPETVYTRFEDLFWRPEERMRPVRTLLSSLRKWRKERGQTILLFKSETSRKRFLRLIADQGTVQDQGLQSMEDLVVKTAYTHERGIYALVSDLEIGADLHWNQTLLLSESIFNPHRKKGRKRVEADFKGLHAFDELHAGDLVVHRDYGLGRFQGLTRIQVERTGHDYLALEFAQGDKLYVPVDRLNLVQIYKGPEGVVPALDRLGGVRWSRTKERVRKALQAIARDLVEMYAFRKVAKGFAYPAADVLYQEFEATFDFEETPDQEQAIKDVLQDMERPEPMDRLVCGDAGFGKTEVAMRAAFRAVSAGKQVALLCPTTVLAEQHYQNFRARMKEFAVNVAMVSRFVPPKEQKKILEAAAKGEVDILIGTHRLLSGDVQLPRLSLFILDEEQRFGVRHKEKLKALRKNIDVLTLTATPIPRTLQLSLSGIRELSVIETPPLDRKPVETSLLEREPAELKAIVQRELARGGQVFWVYNRVKGLARVTEFVRSLVPEAKVGMAHGQMSERSLEETMHRFWRGELDILVCTAIVESGLDFSRANTLIVDQAQMFGLSQLYQLRGRVGRSDAQAYAYFVVPDVGGLTKAARKRLQTILELDYLGAGFKVAMEDLRLRGAGNILGEAQSGNVGKVGLDLFLEMLEEEVRKVRGDPLPQETDPELNIVFPAGLPEGYVTDPGDRLKYYKLLSSARGREELEELGAELKDRFGPFPQEVDNFVAVLRLKRVLAGLQVVHVDLFTNRMVLTWPKEQSTIDPTRFVSWLSTNRDAVRLLSQEKLELRLEAKASISDSILQAIEVLSELDRGQVNDVGHGS